MRLEYTGTMAKIIGPEELKKLGQPKKKIPGLVGRATRLEPTAQDLSQQEVDGFIEFVRKMRQGSIAGTKPLR